MKKVFYLFFFFLIGLLPLWGKDWLLMFYIGADNNLTSYVVKDVDELETMYATSGDMDVVVQVDGGSGGAFGGGGYADATGDGIEEVRRYRLLPDGNMRKDSIDEAPDSSLGEINSASVQTLVNFVEWAVNNYPADHYILVLWNHGAGWTKGDVYKGGLWDDDADDYLSTAGGEWREALDSINKIIGGKLDVLGLDMCVMSYMEVLWDVYPYTKSVVFSEANEPGDGWYYHNWIKNLNENSRYIDSTEILDSIGHWIIDDYREFYDGKDASTLTYVKVNEDSIVKLKNLLYDLSRELMCKHSKKASGIQDAIDNALAMSSGTMYEDFKDLWSFCDKLIEYSSDTNISDLAVNISNDIKSMIDYLNPYDYQYKFDGSHGLGIYLPDDDVSSGFDYPYDSPTHAWNVADSMWTKFIYGDSLTECSSFMEILKKEIKQTAFEYDNLIINSGIISNPNRLPVHINIYGLNGALIDKITIPSASSVSLGYLSSNVYYVRFMETGKLYKMVLIK